MADEETEQREAESYCWDQLVKSFLLTIRLVDGCGGKGQVLIDSKYEDLKQFCVLYDDYSGALPKPWVCRDNGGVMTPKFK